MVDVSDKTATNRVATARGAVFMAKETLDLIAAGGIAKGDVFVAARVAGIMAAKKTADLVPLCHTLPLTSVVLEMSCDESRSVVEITATCKTLGPTGVEMEALTAVAVAALTIYDMCKAVDRAITVSELRLTYKAGGRSGEFRRD